MDQYTELVKKVMNGIKEIGRNGATYSLFGETMRFSLEKLPMVTTKKVSFKNIIEELLWFIHGDTNNQTLKDKGVHIWNANASREFLESVGLKNKENDLGLFMVISGDILTHLILHAKKIIPEKEWTNYKILSML